jgi:glycine C-acetyltransferase
MQASITYDSTVGSLKRLELLCNNPELSKLWEKCITKRFKKKGFNIETNTCVTRFILRASWSYGDGKWPERKLRIFLSIVIYPVIPKGMILHV